VAYPPEHGGMTFLAFALLGLGVPTLIVWLAVVQARKTRANFTQLADKLGLQVEAAQPTLGVFLTAPRARGLTDGRSAELYTFTKGSGKSRTQWCGLSVQLQVPAELSFDLTPQGFASKVAGWFGVKEITVGNARFDDAFFVRTNQPDLLPAALVPDIQGRLLAAQQAGAKGAFKLEKGALAYVEQGSFASPALCAHFVAAAEPLRDLALAAEVVAGK
jgi:hypothetical protein